MQLIFNLTNISTKQKALFLWKIEKKKSNQLIYQCETFNSTNIKYTNSIRFCISIMPFIRGSTIVAP